MRKEKKRKKKRGHNGVFFSPDFGFFLVGRGDKVTRVKKF